MENVSINKRKPKTSKLAIASLVIPVSLWWIAWLVMAIDVFTNTNLAFPLFPPLIYLSLLTGIIIPTIALIKIYRNAQLCGARFAIEGIIISIILFCLSMALARFFISW